MDDTIQKATDARGATATYSYNNRRLVKGIAYSAPAGIPATPSVSVAYDAVGNRISMTDGLGSVSYVYDQLSRMTSESRTIDGVDTFPLTYAYTVAGQLKKITDSTNVTINYDYDNSGRTSLVMGSDTLYGGVSTYASNFEYRAWGALKQHSSGNGGQDLVKLGYTSRGRISEYKITHTTPFSMVTTGGEYQYGADGRLSSSKELTDHRHDRAYLYDHAARLTLALTGTEARGETPAPGWEPFKQNYAFNTFGNLTSRAGHHWGNNVPSFSASYVNNRSTNPQWHYDADGDLLQQTSGQITRQYTYDAAGRQVSITEPPRRPNQPTLTIAQGYDGDGKRVQRSQNSVASYVIRSTVLGAQVVTELNAQGAKVKGHVYANGAKLARQSLNEVTWVHETPDGSGEWESGGIVMRSLALDPLGDDVGVDTPYSGGGDGLGSYPMNGDPTDFQMGCALDGHIMPCESVARHVRFASSIQVISNGLKVPIHQWVLNPDNEPGDACTNGICPPGGVTVHDTGGHFEVAGYHSISDKHKPAMRAMIPLETRNLGRREISALVDDILKLFDANPGCERYHNQLLAALNESTGANAGTIREVLEAFRKEGMISTDEQTRGSGGGVTTSWRGYRNIALTWGDTRERTADTLLHEIIHWAGIFALSDSGYTTEYSHYYTDAAMATAWNKLGVVMTAEQYRTAFPEAAAANRASGLADYAESRLAGAAGSMTCLGIKTDVGLGDFKYISPH